MADFNDIVVDITAEELEERIKKPIDDRPIQGSDNFISSGAVYGSLTSKADKSVATVRTYSDLDTIISKSSDNLVYITFSGLFVDSEVVGSGEFLGLVDSVNSTLLLIDKSSGKMWIYVKGSNQISLADTSVIFGDTYRSLSDLVSFGVKSKKNTLYVFKVIDSLNSIGTSGRCLGYRIEDDNSRNFEFINLTKGGTWKLDLNNVNNGYVQVDKSFLTEDEIDITTDFINAGTFPSLDTLKNYDFKIGKSYRFYITSYFGSIPEGQYVGSVLRIDESEPTELHFSKILYDGVNYILNLDSGNLSSSVDIVDSELSGTSIRPVQNKVVAKAIEDIKNYIDTDTLKKTRIEYCSPEQADELLKEQEENIAYVCPVSEDGSNLAPDGAYIVFSIWSDFPDGNTQLKFCQTNGVFTVYKRVETYATDDHDNWVSLGWSEWKLLNPIDSELSTESENPVQNKIVASNFNQIYSELDELHDKAGITVETDPTVPAWAKQPEKPTYTAEEVGAVATSDVVYEFAEDETGNPIIPESGVVGVGLFVALIDQMGDKFANEIDNLNSDIDNINSTLNGLETLLAGI